MAKFLVFDVSGTDVNAVVSAENILGFNQVNLSDDIEIIYNSANATASLCTITVDGSPSDAALTLARKAVQDAVLAVQSGKYRPDSYVLVPGVTATTVAFS